MSADDDELIEAIKFRLDMCDQGDHEFYDPVEAAFLTQILARIRKLESQIAWQPIETAPKDGSQILLADHLMTSDGYFKPLANGGKGSWIWPSVLRKPTHWKLMPELPRKQKVKE